MKFTADFVGKIADLANLQVDDQDKKDLAISFSETLAYVEKLSQIDVSGVAPTYQVNNLVNVMREDIVEENFQFTQAEALANAKQTHDGYFVVPRILDHEA